MNPTQKRIVVGIVIALCGGALLYVSRNVLADKPLRIGGTSLAAVMIGGGIGSLFRWPIVGALLGLLCYALCIGHCAMFHCLPNNYHWRDFSEETILRIRLNHHRQFRKLDESVNATITLPAAWWPI